MKAEVRSVSSIKLIAETDSDRAILQAFAEQSDNKSLLFHIQSHAWQDSKVQDMCVGFGPAPASQNGHIVDGMRGYIKTLHEAGAVDDTKMHFRSYLPLEECMKLWGIVPHSPDDGQTAR